MLGERVIKKLLGEINSRGECSIGVQLPNGVSIPEGNVDHRVVFKTWESLKKTLKDLEMGFGEGYMNGEIDVQGDLEKLLIVGNSYLNEVEAKKGFSVLFFKVANTLSFANKLKEKKNIEHHYDLGDEFYKLWLDESMTYSCAFFPTPETSLEEAQREKRRIIFEKLLLEDGDTLLDIGCGWGSIILEAAHEYNVECVGITLSENQYSYIENEIKRRGLEGRVRVYLMHYADLPSLGQKFKKVVSVGMFEHVGREHYRAFFKTISEVMEAGGLFLLHTIGKVHPDVQSRWIRKYIFPGGYLPGIPEVLCAFEKIDLCLIDIDDWRLHYYRTLNEWRKRFWDNVDEIRSMYDEKFVRMWNLYLVSAAASFYTGSNHLFQFLFSKGIKNDYPVIKRQFIKSEARAG